MIIMKDISIKMNSYIKDINSRLEFNISSKDTTINNTIVNCMRRVALSLIPVYSFNNITISENTSIFNNNYMKLRLRNLPVLGISSEQAIFIRNKKDANINDEEFNGIMDNEIEMPMDEKLNSSSLKQLTLYLDYVNNTNDIVTVGTNNCKFYYAEKQIESPYIVNIPIIKLQHKQKIKLSAITEIGIEDDNAIYSPVSIFSFKENDHNNYDIMIESRGQLDEKTILNYAIDNIVNMLDNFILLIPDNNSINAKILLDDADHTIGTLIVLGLQNHKKIKFAGYSMPHLLDKKILFQYELVEEYNIKIIMEDIVSLYKKTFETINDSINQHIKY